MVTEEQQIEVYQEEIRCRERDYVAALRRVAHVALGSSVKPASLVVGQEIAHDLMDVHEAAARILAAKSSISLLKSIMGLGSK